MKKLISMTDYVLEQFKKWENDNNPDCQSSARYILGTHIYANFLKQPLTLGMFIPCDENGNVLEYPRYSEEEPERNFDYPERLDKYLKVKSKVIFEGFDIHYRDEQTIILCNNNNDIIEFATNGSVYVFDEYSAETIEDLIFYAKKEQVDLTLNDNFKL